MRETNKVYDSKLRSFEDDPFIEKNQKLLDSWDHALPLIGKYWLRRLAKTGTRDIDSKIKELQKLYEGYKKEGVNVFFINDVLRGPPDILEENKSNYQKTQRLIEHLDFLLDKATSTMISIDADEFSLFDKRDFKDLKRMYDKAGLQNYELGRDLSMSNRILKKNPRQKKPSSFYARLILGQLIAYFVNELGRSKKEAKYEALKLLFNTGYVRSNKPSTIDHLLYRNRY